MLLLTITRRSPALVVEGSFGAELASLLLIVVGLRARRLIIGR